MSKAYGFIGGESEIDTSHSQRQRTRASRLETRELFVPCGELSVLKIVRMGGGRASPKTFYRHHLAANSSAIARADAQTVLRHATDLALRTVPRRGTTGETDTAETTRTAEV